MRIIKAHVCAEVVEKKSRFIADVFPVESVDQVKMFLEQIKKKHYDARHHCYAYIISEDSGGCVLERASDDGEPQGTAGRPILSVLQNAALSNTLIVVTRYFGGILLGTGGLVHAYTHAAKAGLEQAQIVEKIPSTLLTVVVSYDQVSLLKHLLRTEEISIQEERYGTSAEYDIIVKNDDLDTLSSMLTNSFNGRIHIQTIGALR